MSHSRSYPSHIKISVFLSFILIIIAVSCKNPKSSDQIGNHAPQNQLLPFSPMVEANGTLYISGQIAPAENGEIKSIETETKDVMQKIGTILNKNGYNFRDIVRCSVFLTDIDDYTAVNKVYASFFNEKYPSRNAVEVSRLVKGARIEISAIAVKKKNSVPDITEPKE